MALKKTFDYPGRPVYSGKFDKQYFVNTDTDDPSIDQSCFQEYFSRHITAQTGIPWTDLSRHHYFSLLNILIK